MPWRITTDPYKIWLSEIILQQTKVSQGLDYYNSFVIAYPEIKLLAIAKEDQVLNKWRGLGYYNRARNLHQTAKVIMKDYGGVFPSDYKEVLKLKGIGKYTAAAIVSFSFNQAYAVLDGNVYRVLSRLFDLDIPVDSFAGQKFFSELAQQLIDKKNPGIYNQAIMEFGALNCTYKNPNCTDCVFADICLSYLKNTTFNRPVKKAKKKIRKRFFVYFVDISNANNTIIVQKRSDKDIWASLYEFPLIEFFSEDLFLNEIESHLSKGIKVSPIIKHVLSHQKIQAVFVHRFDSKNTLSNGQFRILHQDLLEYPMSRLIDAYVESDLNLNKKK